MWKVVLSMSIVLLLEKILRLTYYKIIHFYLIY